MSKVFLGHNKVNAVLLGCTGAGKTTFISNLVCTEFKNEFNGFIGKTNSTLVNRKIILKQIIKDKESLDRGIDDYSKMIRLAVKKREYMISTDEIFSDIVSVIVYMCKNYKKFGDDYKAFEYMKKEVRKKLTKNNLKSSLLQVEKSILDDGIDKICEVLSKFVTVDKLSLKNGSLNNKVERAEFSLKTSKQNGVLKEIVEQELDNILENDREKIISVFDSFNESLNSKFDKFFGNAKMSSDGYYYIDLVKENGMFSKEHSDIVNNLFVNNNIEEDDDFVLSLEILFSEILIYIGINENLVKRIRIRKDSEYLNDCNGSFEFSILDTKGIFHDDQYIDESKDYVESIVYNNIYDSIIYIKPMCNDSNSKKTQEVVSDVFSSLNKEVPVFVFNNKVDLFINEWVSKKALNKSYDVFDDFDSDFDEDENFSASECVNDLRVFLAKQKDSFDLLQKNKKHLLDFNLNLYMFGAKNEFIKEILKQEKVKKDSGNEYLSLGYGDAVFKMFGAFFDYYMQSYCEIRFMLDKDAKDDKLSVYINDSNFSSIVSKHILSGKTITKINFMKDNISSNYGIRPHGNSFNALCRHIYQGDGFESNISSYYYNCKNFKINFPTTCREIFDRDFIEKIIRNSCKLNGGKFETNGYDDFIQNVLYYRFHIAKSITKNIFYDQILQVVIKENPFSSPKFKYNEFLSRAHTFICSEEFKKQIQKELEYFIEEAIILEVSNSVKFV